MNKRLYRSRKESMLGGVCGGIAEYFNIDPTLVRLLFAVFLIISFGTAILVYLLAWIIVPQAPIEPQYPQQPQPQPQPQPQYPPQPQPQYPPQPQQPQNPGPNGNAPSGYQIPVEPVDASSVQGNATNPPESKNL